nr:F10 [uncultured bacterium]
MPTHVAKAAAPATPLVTKPIDITGAKVAAYTQSWVDWFWTHWLQIVIASAVGAGIVLLLLGVKLLGGRLCDRDRGGRTWTHTVGSALASTRLWFMIPLAAHLVAGYAHPPADVVSTIRFFFVVASALQAALWGRELILGVVERRAGGDEHHGSALGIIRLLVSFALFALAAILILDNLGVNVTGLIAGLGIGGIAIGLAAQGIFADLFAALAILFDKPFRRGDAIKWDGTSGTVEAIGLKSTRVRAITGEQVVISNTNLLNKELHNLARLDRRRNVLKIGVIYQTPVEVCEQIPAMIRKIVEAQDKCSVVRVGMTGFGDSSLDYELQFDVHSEVYNEVFDAHSHVCLAILRTFNEAGIEFAYPTQMSIVAGPDGKPLPGTSDASQPTGDAPIDTTPAPDRASTPAAPQ